MGKAKYCQDCGTILRAGSNFCEGCGKSLKGKKSLRKESSNDERPAFLMVWLILMIIGNFISLFGVIVFPPVIVLVMFNFACIIALFNWRKWGYYGQFVTLGLSFLMNSAMAGPVFGLLYLILGFVGIIILYLAMRPVWEKFE